MANDAQNTPGEVVQGMAVPTNAAEVQAAKDHSAEVGKPSHGPSVITAQKDAQRLGSKYGLKKK
jgi:hypothetical protein